MNESNGDFAFWTARSISPAGVALVTASFDRILSITMCDIDHWKLTRRSRGAHALAALMALARPVDYVLVSRLPEVVSRCISLFQDTDIEVRKAARAAARALGASFKDPGLLLGAVLPLASGKRSRLGKSSNAFFKKMYLRNLFR
mmetsp:Transcript_4306/g.13534  ORF Transcript_4306/g.13534 Transcript_4306/m.13534 type:complete len:145 (-) Transcript_4306:1546-1980(-)